MRVSPSPVPLNLRRLKMREGQLERTITVAGTASNNTKWSAWPCAMIRIFSRAGEGVKAFFEKRAPVFQGKWAGYPRSHLAIWSPPQT
jgi:hypothetical protein